MLRDVIIPGRIGNYFLYPKKILSFEINPMMISAILIEYSSNTITIKNTQQILLKDMTAQAQSNALKKIASNIGSYDSIITTLPSTTVIFKELEIPFIGQDNIAMIIGYEVESLLPFALENAVIDFIITHQDLEKNQSKVLVAAIRKEDLQEYTTLFEKAELTLDVATIDIFALYELYQHLFKPAVIKKTFTFNLKSSPVLNWFHTIKNKITKKAATPTTENTTEFQPKTATLLVDIGFDVTRVLYFQNNELFTLRMIPTGISDMAAHMQQNNNAAYYDIMHNILTLQHISDIQTSLEKELNGLFEEINRTLQFFEKQQTQRYLAPEKIIFSGILTTHELFQTQAESFFSMNIQILKPTNALQTLHVKTKNHAEDTSILNISLAFFEYFNQFVNILKNVNQKKDNSLLNKQIIAIILITITTISLTIWKSSQELTIKESAYSSSKRQFIQTIQDRMHIDLSQEKNIKLIVEKTENKLKTEKNLWLAFSTQQEQNLLLYLQDLSVHIDRTTLNLQIKNLHLDYDKVTMTGTLKDYADIAVFQDELMELQLLQPLEQIRDLNFAITFKPKHIQSKVEPKGNRS